MYPEHRYEHMYYANHLRPEDTRIPSTSDDDVDNVEEDKEVDRNVVREEKFEMVVEYEDKEVRTVADPKFYQIREEARAILGIINRGDNPPNDHINLLCERIINTDNE